MLRETLGRFVGRRTKILHEAVSRRSCKVACRERGKKSRDVLTGKTRGIPPLTAFDPSRCALWLTNRFSLPAAVFHERTVAPKRRTSTDSPVGRLAVTLELSPEMDTCGVGMVGETGIAEGFLDRSMMPMRLTGIVCGAEDGRSLEGRARQSVLRGEEVKA